MPASSGGGDFSPWTGAFRDRAREQAYCDALLADHVRQSHYLIWIVTAGHVLLGAIDVIRETPYPTLAPMILGALGVVVAATAGEIALRRQPDRRTAVAAITVFAFASLAASALGVLARPEGAVLVPARVITALALIYLFVPFSLQLRHMLAVGAAASNFGCWLLGSWAAMPASLMINAGVLSAVVALVGTLAAARLEISRRVQWARSSELAAANARLRHEIADRLRAEEELRAARDRAEEGARAKSRFLAMMSHEIRTPMNGILGMAHLLLDSPLQREQREFADAIRRSGEGLLAVLDDILDFSKLEAGRMEIHPTAVDLWRLLDEVAALVACRAEEKGLTLRVQKAPEVPRWVEVDPSRLRQVLLNLLSNAVKFTEEGGVTLCVASQGKADLAQLRVTVTDSGIGISDEAKGRLFSDFGQADASISRRYGGTGLGLAISKRLLALMGGRIGVESREGAGSTFWFELPVRALPGPPTSPPREAPKTVRPLRVLLAEDNEINRRVAETLLQRRGHRVEVVTDGAQAVSAVRQGDYDVVLMDLQMPEVDGLEATRRIRALPPPHGRVPIIAMTANALRGDEERCLAAGMDGYVPKPLDVERLERTLARHAGGEDGGSSSAEDHLRVLRETFGAAFPELVARFLSQARENAAALARAAARGDTASAQDPAHALRSSAAQFGLAELSALAGEAEDACRGNRPETLPELSARIERAVEEAVARLGPQAEGADSPAEPQSAG